jgi:LAO/AO transport system kinase
MLKKTENQQKSVNPNYRLKKSDLHSPEVYVNGILSHNRTLLSQAITLIESTQPERRNLGEVILEACLHKTGNSVRIGITGVPGVGKSTFIDAFGKKLIDDGKRIAVLTVDPSSSRSKGSILGDKTRMEFLSTHSNAFIRPSPASGTLGGVALKTREAMLLCEAAGFDTIFIETVGVGQSETSVHFMVDFFLLLMLAGAGDELQGIKRGIMEMADLIAINKADGENVDSVERARLEFKNALSLFPPMPSGWKPTLHTCSALEETGLDEIKDDIEKFVSHSKKNGYFETNREEQSVYWMHEAVNHLLKEKFYESPSIQKKIKQAEKEVQSGKMSAFKAASQLMIYLEK